MKVPDMRDLFRRALLLGLAAGFAALPAAAANPVHRHRQRTITIGAVVAASGAYAGEGVETRLGYNFWRDYVNAHGGLRINDTSYRISIVYLDDGSNPNVTAKMTERLLDVEHVAFLLGPYGSAETLAAAAVAEQHQVPMVAGAGALEKIYDQGYHYTFGVMAPARKYLAGVIDFATTQRPKPAAAAIVGALDGFSLEAQQGAIQLANDHGIRVPISDRYPVGSNDFNALAKRIADAHVDLVLDAGHADEAIALQRALAQVNARAKLYAYVVGPDTPEFVQSLGPFAEQAMEGAQWSTSIPDVSIHGFYPTAADYAKAFAQRYHHQANYHNAAASAAGFTLQMALAKAHSLNAARVRRALAVTNMPTFFGRIRFDERGVNTYRQMVVNQIQGRRLVTIYPKRAAQARAIYPSTPWSAR